MARILGLDISTTTIGISILEHNDGKDIKLIHQEYFKPPEFKISNMFDMLYDVTEHIRAVYDKWNPDEIAIEEFIQFMKGGSGAKTIIPLAILNRVIGFCFYLWGKEPFLYNVLTIRHAIKMDKKLPPKEEIPELLAKRLNIKFPYYYKINKRTKKQQIMEESYDVADSVAVGLAHIIKSNKK